jgi:hypothetical protein
MIGSQMLMMSAVVVTVMMMLLRVNVIAAVDDVRVITMMKLIPL